MCYNGGMKKKSAETRVSIRFPSDVLAGIRIRAQSHERSLNGEVIWALRCYLATPDAESPRPVSQEKEQ